MADNTELTDMISMFSTLTPATLTNYKNTYKRLRKLTGVPLGELSDKQLIKFISDADVSVGAKITLLITATNIFVSQSRDVVPLQRYRKILNESLKDANATKAGENDLPPMSELIKFTNELYKKKKYRDFVINYLMITFGVRNMDLNLLISASRKLVVDDENYLIVGKKSISYIRNNFKTSAVYGARKHIIKDKKFMNAVTELLGDKIETPLLTQKNGTRIAENTLGTYVKRLTYDRLGEGKYFKIIVSADGKANFERLTASRGTSTQVAMEHYDQTFKNEAGAFTKKLK